MAAELDERLLEELYTWIDSIPLTRPKKDLKRDFSDGALVAEVVKHYYPHLVELHNYPAVQGITKKTTNWNILNRKVFRRLGLEVSGDLIHKMVTCKAWCAEQFLLLLRQRLETRTHSLSATDKCSGDESELANDKGDGLPTVSALTGVKLLGGQHGKLDTRLRDQDKLTSTALVDNIADLNVKSWVEGKLQELDTKNETIHVLQSKVKRLEHLLQQKEVRVVELQSRCRRLEKERGKLIAGKSQPPPPSPPQQQQQQLRQQDADKPI